MPLVADRVAETTTTTGTGSVALAGAKAGYQTFVTAFGYSVKVYYCITDNTDWEVGIGELATGPVLTRDSILASSNAGAAVNWGAGTKDVFSTAPMQSIVGAPRIYDRTTAYTVVASDNGSILNFTLLSLTVSLTAAATLGRGFTCWIWNTSSFSATAITIDPNGSETIDGVSTLILRRGEGTQIICDGTNWQTGDKKAMRGYADNLGPTEPRPDASGSVSVAIGSFSRATGSGSLAVGRSTLASATNATAIGRDAEATSSNSCAIALNSGGNGSRAVTGSGAMALGGSYASGSDSFAAAIDNNTSSYGATAANSIAMGDRAKATSSDAVAIGNLNSSTAFGSISLGISNTASSNAAFACGQGNTASGTYTAAVGYYNTASQSHSFVCGAYGLAGVINKFVYGSNFIGSNGAVQYGLVPLAATTTDATATVLTTSAAAAGTTNQIILPDNSAYAFTGTVVARQQAAGGTASAAWKVEGLIRREANAASTTLVGSTVTAIDNTPGWTLALSADTTNGGLAITATGAAATNIRWVATVQTSEVTYA